MSSEAVIVSAFRTAVGTYGGSLKSVGAVELGSIVLKAALDECGVEPQEVDEVFMGCVLQSGLGQNVARQASLRAGLPVEVPATTVNLVCGSGLKSVMMAAEAVSSGKADVILAGGTENMSAAPYGINGSRWGMRMGDGKVQDLMIKDGLWCALGDYHMGITAENIAERYGITRQMQDEFALESQQKARAAIDGNRFKEEIVPVTIPRRKKEPLVFEVDEHPRETSLEILAKLPAAFKKDGTVTAGNASGINDCAAAVLVMSLEKASALGLIPLARICSHATVGVEPEIMGTGPIPATKKALLAANWQVEDLDLVEANEAFASQAICVLKKIGFDPARVNVNGGAIALGHPIGASGTRILVTLLHEMIKRKSRRGLATLCVGGGQGVACTVERE